MLPTWLATSAGGGGVRSRAGPDHVRSFTSDASWLPWHLTLGTSQVGRGEGFNDCEGIRYAMAQKVIISFYLILSHVDEYIAKIYLKYCSKFPGTLRTHASDSSPSRRLTCAAAAAETDGDGRPGAAASVREISTADWHGGSGHGHHRREAPLRCIGRVDDDVSFPYLKALRLVFDRNNVCQIFATYQKNTSEVGRTGQDWTAK